VQLGKYTLVRRLAAGGMGEVWEGSLAGEGGFERRVAIKRMVEGFTGPWELMFLDEAKLVSRLHHSNIVQVLDFGIADAVPFQVLELVEGIDAGKLLQLAKPTEAIALHLCAEVAHALDHAHTARDANGAPMGIVHRDVSPENILVSWGADVKLTDFGIAFAHDRHHKTVGGQTKGKAAYMAPEQALAGEIDARTDLFALGCVLHTLLTGKSPLAGEDKLIALLSGNELTLDPSLDPAIAAVIAKAVRRSRGDRYDSAAEMGRVLGELLQSRLTQSPRVELKGFLEQVKAKSKPKRGSLDALLAPGTGVGDVVPAAKAATLTVPAMAKTWRWRWPLGAGLALASFVATIAVLRAQQAADVAPVVVVPATPAPVTAEAPAPQPVVVEPPPVVQPPRQRPHPQVAKAAPTEKGVVLIGGEGAARAEIFIDGKTVGYAPKRLELFVGSHSVELVTPAGKKLGPAPLAVTVKHTESEPLKYLVP
jgi:hypothetical protein